MKFLNDRIELAKLAGDMRLRFCAEIGVYDGFYSEIICKNVPNVVMICVDTWAPSRNHRNPIRLDNALQEARMRLRDYQAIFMKLPSVEAAEKVPDGSLDFVYVDALHDYKNVRDDLNAWDSTLRVGGIFAGHDWGHAGVTKAVEEFAQKKGIKQINVTGICEPDNMPSWWWVKC